MVKKQRKLWRPSRGYCYRCGKYRDCDEDGYCSECQIYKPNWSV